MKWHNRVSSHIKILRFYNELWVDLIVAFLYFIRIRIVKQARGFAEIAFDKGIEEKDVERTKMLNKNLIALSLLIFI